MYQVHYSVIIKYENTEQFYYRIAELPFVPNVGMQIHFISRISLEIKKVTYWERDSLFMIQFEKEVNDLQEFEDFIQKLKDTDWELSPMFNQNSDSP